MSRTSKQSRQSLCTCIHFVLTDDIAQTATYIETLQEHMIIWNECLNINNLKLNLKKTEVLVVSRTEKEAVVTLDQCQLNQATPFKYLGCITGNKGSAYLQNRPSLK